MNELFHGDGLEHLPAFATSLAIGLLMGLERERSTAAKAGLRTFGLAAMLGTLLALISERMASPWMLATGFAAVTVTIVAAYMGEADGEDPGTTTQAALLLCFGLGAAIWFGFGALSIMVAITSTILLHYKPELQTMSRNLSRRDLQSILQFAVLSFVILPILPDRDYGPYGTLNPYQTWWMVVLISGVSLAGYVALRTVGQRYGAPLLGFLGGMVSSTATTLVYARHARNDAMCGLAVVVVVIANLVVLIRLAVISGVMAPAILPHLLPVLGCGLVFGMAGAFYWWRHMSSGELPMPQIDNPTEIKTALSFAALYAMVLLAAAWLSNTVGQSALYLLAVVSGLTDVDAISLSSLQLFKQGKLYETQVVMVIAIAYLSNLAFKLGMLGFIGGKMLVRRAVLGMGTVAIGVIVGMLLF